MPLRFSKFSAAARLDHDCIIACRRSATTMLPRKVRSASSWHSKGYVNKPLAIVKSTPSSNTTAVTRRLTAECLCSDRKNNCRRVLLTRYPQATNRIFIIGYRYGSDWVGPKLPRSRGLSVFRCWHIGCLFGFGEETHYTSRDGPSFVLGLGVQFALGFDKVRYSCHEQMVLARILCGEGPQELHSSPGIWRYARVW